MRLYYHKTDGGAEYLFDAYIECPNGHREGVVRGAKYALRIDLESDVQKLAAAEAMYDALKEIADFLGGGASLSPYALIFNSDETAYDHIQGIIAKAEGR